MEKWFDFESVYGGKYKVCFEKAAYVVNGRLAVKMMYLDDEFGCELPFANATVNIDDDAPFADWTRDAYLDQNNVPNIMDFLIEIGAGEFTGEFGVSGFCYYPLFRFNEDFLAALDA